MLALGGECARDDLVGGVIAAHGIDGQYRIRHRRAGAGHGEVIGASRAPGSAVAVRRALGPGPGLPACGLPLWVVCRGAQRVTRGVPAGDDASLFVSFTEPCLGSAPIMALARNPVWRGPLGGPSRAARAGRDAAGSPAGLAAGQGLYG